MTEEMDDIFQPGEHFHGCVVQKLLGKGSGGAVYLVHHEALDTLYALKVLDPRIQADNADYIKRFLREARLASRIRHPNLVSVHDCGHDEEKNLYYLMMDYVPGTSLRNLLAFEGTMPPNRAIDIVAQVSAAMEAAQAFHVVHRDIKPENIIVQSDGRIKLVDLGIAKAQDLGDSIQTNTESVFGTPSYISPEQAQCSADVDMRADIYSLGIVFFEMLTGQCPYVGANPAVIIAQILSDEQTPDVRDVTPGIAPELAILVRRMTMKDRSRRIATFGAVLDELSKLGIGHVSRTNSDVEIAARPVAGMKTLLDGLGDVSKPEAATLSSPPNGMRGFLAKVAMMFRKNALRKCLFTLVGTFA
jgi:serine/threonine-protein kinase